MRFLHTADWHVGKTLFGRSRLDEQEEVIAEIIEIARRELVDCVLLAGDVFDTFAPTGDAERVVCDALAAVAGLGIAVVVAGGNHDHPRRLAALRKLGNPLKIFVRPDPARPSDGGVIELVKGNEAARIAVLPWVPEFKTVDICRMMNPEDSWYEAYSENVAKMCRHLTSEFTEETVNILTAHLFAFGAETSGSERAVHVAQPFAVKPGQFPKEAQYIALGHIHKGSKHLRTLSSDRYEFVFEGDEFMVSDHFNADETRSVKTLSGGESFLASLSLALALAESITQLNGEQGAVSLESLFLDEGFSTLDSETLTKVADAIELLQDGNRLIGIITHVQSLAEQMPVRIEIEKTVGGSRIIPQREVTVF